MIPCGYSDQCLGEKVIEELFDREKKDFVH
jgi:hypothetical protein